VAFLDLSDVSLTALHLSEMSKNPHQPHFLSPEKKLALPKVLYKSLTSIASQVANPDGTKA
jgi:hypothetical protein